MNLSGKKMIKGKVTSVTKLCLFLYFSHFPPPSEILNILPLFVFHLNFQLYFNFHLFRPLNTIQRKQYEVGKSVTLNLQVP